MQDAGEQRDCKGELECQDGGKMIKMPDFKTYREKLEWCDKNKICPDCERPLNEPVNMCTRWHCSPMMPIVPEPTVSDHIDSNEHVKYCSSCGRLRVKGEDYCPECGTLVTCIGKRLM